MSGWDGVACEEGAQRARNAGWAVSAYILSWVLLFASLTADSSLGLLAWPLIAGIWVWCLVASLRVLVHARESRHDEGRGTALFGMFLTTGFVGLIIAIVLVPAAGV